MMGSADMATWWHSIELDRSLLSCSIVVTRGEDRYIRQTRSFIFGPGRGTNRPFLGFGTNTANPTSQFSSLVRITSMDELLYYYDENREFLPQGMMDRFFRHWPATLDFQASAMLILKVEDTSGSHVLELASICSPPSSSVVDIRIRRSVPEDGETGMRFWYFILMDSMVASSEYALIIRDE